MEKFMGNPSALAGVTASEKNEKFYFIVECRGNAIAAASFDQTAAKCVLESLAFIVLAMLLRRDTGTRRTLFFGTIDQVANWADLATQAEQKAPWRFEDLEHWEQSKSSGPAKKTQDSCHARVERSMP
jgi:hypothetical protein